MSIVVELDKLFRWFFLYKCIRATPAVTPKSGLLLLIWVLPPIFVGSDFLFHSNCAPQIEAPKLIPLENDRWDPLVIVSSSFVQRARRRWIRLELASRLAE